MRKLLFFLIIILISVVSCTKVKEESNNSDIPNEITIDTSMVDFTSEGGTYEVCFTSSGKWTADIINSRASDWCVVNPNSGLPGKSKIRISATANDNPEDRTASIIIKSELISSVINVSQKQKDALTVTSSRFEVASEGGEIKIEVKANMEFEYIIEESSSEWISHVNTRAMKESILVFDIAENDNINKREGRIFIKSGDIQEAITIYQSGIEPTIILSKNEYMIASSGETIEVEVNSNIDVKAEISTEIDWIVESITRANSTNMYSFDILPNSSYDSRTAEIKFTNNEISLSESIKIIQAQEDAIIVGKPIYEFGIEGGELNLEVQTNVDFNVSISQEAQTWIKPVSTKGLETNNLYFNIDACDSNICRSGVITIAGGNVIQQIVVKQEFLIPEYQIYYTTKENKILTLNNATAFDANIISHKYENGLGIITFDKPITIIGENAFNESITRGNSSNHLSTIKLPNSIEEIGTRAFESCSYLTSIKLSNRLKVIEEQAFISCFCLRNIIIPETIEEIKYMAFYQCEALDLLKINSPKCNIGKSAFGNCTQLSEIEISCNKIEEGAFWNNYELVNVLISNGIVSIGERAFKGCSKLSSITIPDSVEYLGKEVFAQCYNLTSFYGKYSSADNKCLVYNNEIIAVAAGVLELIIPDGVLKVGESLFYNNTNLVSVTISDSVTEIGADAFYGCNNLCEIKLPESLTTIGDSAFFNCTKLTNISLPNSLLYIGEAAFGNCKSVSYINIPENINYIGEGAFAYCNIKFEGKYATSDNKAIIFNNTLIAFSPLEGTEYSIPEEVTHIGLSVFYDCNMLSRIIIPDGVVSIGKYAFCGCSSLTEISLPNTVAHIGMLAFARCSSLTSITIPNEVTQISQQLFDSCTNLSNIIIPNSVTTIDAYAFNNNSSLREITLPKSLEKISNYIFRGCTNLLTIKIKAIKPPVESSYNNQVNLFYSTPKDLIIYVPKESMKEYKNSNWRKYNIIGYDFD